MLICFFLNIIVKVLLNMFVETVMCFIEFFNE